MSSNLAVGIQRGKRIVSRLERWAFDFAVSLSYPNRGLIEKGFEAGFNKAIELVTEIANVVESKKANGVEGTWIRREDLLDHIKTKYSELP